MNLLRRGRRETVPLHWIALPSQRYVAICTIASISTAMPLGGDAIPTTGRAWRLHSKTLPDDAAAMAAICERDITPARFGNSFHGHSSVVPSDLRSVLLFDAR